MEKTVDIVYHGVPLTVMVDYDPGEPAITSGPSDNWQPGVPSSAVLIRATAGGADVMPLISGAAELVIEHAALEKIEEQK